VNVWERRHGRKAGGVKEREIGDDKRERKRLEIINKIGNIKEGEGS
jgi:hypothetical protein